MFFYSSDMSTPFKSHCIPILTRTHEIIPKAVANRKRRRREANENPPSEGGGAPLGKMTSSGLRRRARMTRGLNVWPGKWASDMTISSPCPISASVLSKSGEIAGDIPLSIPAPSFPLFFSFCDPSAVIPAIALGSAANATLPAETCRNSRRIISISSLQPSRRASRSMLEAHSSSPSNGRSCGRTPAR